MDRKSREKDPRSAKVRLASIRREYNELFKDTVARSTQLQELKKSKQRLQAEVNFLRKRARLLRQSDSQADTRAAEKAGGESMALTPGDQDEAESEGQEYGGGPSSNGLPGYDAAYEEEIEPEALDHQGVERPVQSSSEEISGFTTSRSDSPGKEDDFANGESQDMSTRDRDEVESASASDDDLEVYAADDSDRSS